MPSTEKNEMSRNQDIIRTIDEDEEVEDYSENSDVEVEVRFMFF